METKRNFTVEVPTGAFALSKVELMGGTPLVWLTIHANGCDTVMKLRLSRDDAMDIIGCLRNSIDKLDAFGSTFSTNAENAKINENNP